MSKKPILNHMILEASVLLYFCLLVITSLLQVVVPASYHQQLPSASADEINIDMADKYRSRFKGEKLSYTNKELGISFHYPGDYIVYEENGYNPYFSSDAITIREQYGTQRVMILVYHNNTNDDLEVASNSIFEHAWHSSGPIEVKDVRIGDYPAKQFIYKQDGLDGQRSHIIISIVQHEAHAYVFITQTHEDTVQYANDSNYDYDIETIYDEITSSVKLSQPEMRTDSFPLLPVEPLKVRIGPDVDGEDKSSVQFQWPTTGYIDWIYNRDGHNGIDIWTNTEGTGNDGIKGNPVYPAYPGKVTAIYSNDLVPSGIRIEHDDIDGTEVWTHYWHLGREETRDEDGNVTDNGESYILVSNQQQVDLNTMLGYQGNACYQYYDPDMETHVHMTVADGKSDSNAIDPTPYYDVELNYGEDGHVDWMYYVETGATTGDTDDCTPPASGDWIVEKSCEFTGSATSPADVIVKDNSTLTIDASALLDINFLNYRLDVRSGSGVLIESGGKIY